MKQWRVERKIKYEAELNPEFAEEISNHHVGKNLFSCIQCGTCSGICPLSIYMDYTPRRIIAMTRAGFKEDVLKSFTIWLCASCYNCTVECPKEIKITEIMYALKQRAIHEGVYPKHFPIPILAREFYHLVHDYGRNHEGLLLFKFFLKTNPFNLIKQSWLGLRLFLKGRLEILPQSIKRKEEFKPILEYLDRPTKSK